MSQSLKTRILSIALALSLIVTMMPFVAVDSYAATTHTYNGEEVITGTTSYSSNMGSGKSVPYYYSDGYFLDNSTSYNNHLSTLSMAMAMSTMNNNGGNTAKSFLSNIGCDNISSIGYGQTPTENTVAAVYGMKTLFKGTDKECVLVPITLRSAYYGEEWANNFQVGETGDAQGFAGAASKVFDAVKSYVSNKGINTTSEVKFWVAGYSRGGSIGNILGKLLSDQYGKERVYGYSFESQMTTTSSDRSDYKNLFAVSNYNDLLTLLYPEYMGFGYYGTNVTFASNGDITNSEDEMIKFLETINTAPEEYKSPTEFKYAKVNSTITKLADDNTLSLISDILKIVNDFNDDKFDIVVYDSASTEKYSQRTYGEQLLKLVQKKALVNRKAYVNNSNRDVDINNASLTGGSPYTVEQSAMKVLSFIENTSQSQLDELADNFEDFSFADYITEVGKIQGLLKYVKSMKLANAWDTSLFNTQGNDTRYKNMISFLWKVLNTSSSDGKYLGIDGLVKANKLTSQQASDLKNALPILLYTAACMTSNDLGNTPELLATLYYSFDCIAQAHYPEINISWLMTKDSYYTGEEETHSHTYDRTVVADKYLKTKATCTTEAVYYKSCECGAASLVDTFKSGSPLGHSFSNSWSKDGSTHWHECTRADCDAKKDVDSHSGGNATCTKRAVCSVCGSEYGDFADHVFDQEVVKPEYLKSEATCLSKAIYYKSCECGERSESDVFETSALGHDIVHYDGKAATCTTKGWAPYDKCSRCEYSTYQVVNALGHKVTTASAGNNCYYNHCARCGVNSNYYMNKSYLKSLKLKKGKKSFTVKWKKQSKKNRKKFTGYQIRYSKYSNMSGAKYVKVKNSKSSKKISKLAKKTKYYVQVRTYYKSYYYSSWGKVKSVKTK